MRLPGRVAIVTGSSTGIGRGIAERLAAEGARVVINSRHREELEAVAESIRSAGGEVLAVAADVGNREGVARVFDETLRAFGGVDVLVNNAGWASPVAHFLEMDEEHWDTVIRTNLKSVYLCSHRAATLMVEQGRRGCIIAISSFGASRAHRQMAAYDATKGGIEAFTRAVALDLAPFDIRVNAVAPGAIFTERYQRATPEYAAQQAATVPLGRAGRPADIAGAVVFLSSDDAVYVTGQTLIVDGGMLSQLRSPQVDRPLPDSVAARLKDRG